MCLRLSQWFKFRFVFNVVTILMVSLDYLFFFLMMLYFQQLFFATFTSTPHKHWIKLTPWHSCMQSLCALNCFVYMWSKAWFWPSHIDISRQPHFNWLCCLKICHSLQHIKGKTGKASLMDAHDAFWYGYCTSPMCWVDHTILLSMVLDPPGK